MNPETILQAVIAVSNAFNEGFKAAQTLEGQAFLKQMREDRAAFERFWRETAQWFERLFKEQLPPAPPSPASVP